MIRIAAIGPASCTVELAAGRAGVGPAEAGTTAAGLSPVEVTLLQCLPKGAKMDLIVRQAIEAGVGRIVPVASERSAPLSGDSGRLARWRRIAREALEQSGAGRVPEVCEVAAIGEAARRHAPADRGTAIFFHERGDGAVPLHELLADGPREVVVLVGPEGGLSDREARLLADAGFRQAWLGPTVLRVETAAVFAVAAVGTVLREREAWQPSRGG